MSYLDEVLADSPWGYWPSNDPSGSTNLADASGNGRPMMLVETPAAFQQPGPSPDQTAIAWPSSINTHARTSAVPSSSVDRTLEAWVYFSAIPTGRVVVAALAESNSTINTEMAIGIDGGKPFHWYWNGGIGQVTASAPLEAGNWYHLVGIASSAGHRIRVNKVDVASTSSGAAAVGARWVRIHSGPASTDAAYLIGPTAYYRAALTNARLDAHFDAMLATPTGLPLEVDTPLAFGVVVGASAQVARVEARALTSGPASTHIARVQGRVLVRRAIVTLVARHQTRALVVNWAPRHIVDAAGTTVPVRLVGIITAGDGTITPLSKNGVIDTPSGHWNPLIR